MSSETVFTLNVNDRGFDFLSMRKEEIKALAWYIARKYEND